MRCHGPLVFMRCHVHTARGRTPASMVAVCTPQAPGAAAALPSARIAHRDAGGRRRQALVWRSDGAAAHRRGVQLDLGQISARSRPDLGQISARSRRNLGQTPARPRRGLGEISPALCAIANSAARTPPRSMAQCPTRCDPPLPAEICRSQSLTARCHSLPPLPALPPTLSAHWRLGAGAALALRRGRDAARGSGAGEDAGGSRHFRDTSRSLHPRTLPRHFPRAVRACEGGE